MIDLIIKLQEAWRVHPQYNGCDDYPPLRLVIDHDPGPYGNTFSISICSVFTLRSELRRIGRLHIIGDWTWNLEEIEPEDDLSGHRIIRFWDFPNNAGFNYRARELFKQRFPKAKTVVNMARKIWRTRLRAPDGSAIGPSKLAVFERAAEARGWRGILDGYGLKIAEVWAVASNQARPNDVDTMGRYQLPLF